MSMTTYTRPTEGTNRIMNTTLVVLGLALLLYIAACVRQWRRLSEIERKKKTGSPPQGTQS